MLHRWLPVCALVACALAVTPLFWALAAPAFAACLERQLEDSYSHVRLILRRRNA